MTKQFTIATLADHPTAVPLLARWCYDQWGRADGFTLAHELDRFERALHATRTNTLPWVLIALDGDTDALVHRARQYGVTQLHLQTEVFTGGLYARLGWKPMFRAVNHGVDVLVMRRDLVAD